MSWDVKITNGERTLSYDYTSNIHAIVSDHLVAAPGGVDEGGEGKADQGAQRGLMVLDSMTTEEAAATLYRTFEELSLTRISFFNQSNDTEGDARFVAHYQGATTYGSVVGVLIFLANILAACSQIPNGKVSVCS